MAQICIDYICTANCAGVWWYIYIYMFMFRNIMCYIAFVCMYIDVHFAMVTIHKLCNEANGHFGLTDACCSFEHTHIYTNTYRNIYLCNLYQHICDVPMETFSKPLFHTHSISLIYFIVWNSIGFLVLREIYYELIYQWLF